MNALQTLALAAALAQAAVAPNSTCEVRGRITDKETGMPIARAIVQLSPRDGKQSFSARTDEDGRYAFTGLPPGTYGGSVEAGDFRATHLGQPLGSPRGFSVKAGQVQADVNAALPRALAITVRVANDDGEPLTGARVSVIGADSGRTVNLGWRRSTDDRGRLRVFSLYPGRYKVCAEVGRGVSDSSRRERFVKTCYPSATEAQAEAVKLEGADIEDLEIRMRRGRTFAISGTLLDSSGNLVRNATVSLGTFWRNGSGSTGIIKLDADGRFTAVDVEPGDYTIQAWIGGPNRPEDRRDLEMAFAPIRIDSADVTDLVVSTAKAVQVAGRVTLEDPAVPLPRRPGYAPLLVQARLAATHLPGSAGSQGGLVGEDHVFYLTHVFGRRTFEVANVPPGWFVKSIKYEGKDITDVPTELKGSRDPSALEIVLSTRGVVVSGRVVDERGEPVPRARAVIFPADPTRWGTFEVPSATVSPAGTFKLGPQRGGEYFVVALRPSVPVPDFEDRERMARLAEAAERVTLGDVEERTIDLRVANVR